MPDFRPIATATVGNVVAAIYRTDAVPHLRVTLCRPHFLADGSTEYLPVLMADDVPTAIEALQKVQARLAGIGP